MIYSLIKLIGHRNLGFILSLIVVLNLAIGSLVMNIYADIYPPFFPFDLNYFFDPIRAEHSWLYALIITFFIFSINLTACLIESAVELVQSNTQRLRRSAALLIHLALLLTMGAHLLDGFYGETQQGTISNDGVLIPGIGLVNTTSVNNIYHPDGSLKDTEVILNIERADGEKQVQRIAYNEPAIFDNGEWEIIIQSGNKQATGFVLAHIKGGGEIALTDDRAHELKSGFIALQGMVQTKMGPFAQISWKPHQSNRETKIIALNSSAGQHSKLNLSGELYQFKELIYEPSAAVMVRYNPAILLVILALIIASIGLILLKPIGFRRQSK